jgi:hypothetical protein
MVMATALFGAKVGGVTVSKATKPRMVSVAGTFIVVVGHAAYCSKIDDALFPAKVPANLP